VWYKIYIECFGRVEEVGVFIYGDMIHFNHCNSYNGVNNCSACKDRIIKYLKEYDGKDTVIGSATHPIASLRIGY